MDAFRCHIDESGGLADLSDDELYAAAIDSRRTSEDEAAQMVTELRERAASRAALRPLPSELAEALRDPAGWPSIAAASRMIRDRIARAYRRLAA